MIDDGVTANHPDLPAARQVRLNGSNFADGNANDPAPQGEWSHGNACAGIIAATQDNNQGISGLAPNCRIMPIRIINSNGTFVSESLIANAITFAYNNGASVISCSWASTSMNPNASPVIVSAIQNAVTIGRGGRGTIVVFSTGNNNFVQFPANAQVQTLFTVGASDRTDHRANYSPVAVGGPNPNNQSIDLVATSHLAYPNAVMGETLDIWSMDSPGLAFGNNPYPANPAKPHPPATGEILPNAGVNFDAYTGRFGGTSAAAPQVAGIAALVLSLNPTLTAAQVFDLIRFSCDQVGGYVYNLGISSELGYGRANACRALTGTLAGTAITSPSKFVCVTPITLSIPNMAPDAVINWVVSSPGVIVSGQGTSSLVMRRSSNTSPGQITVTATVNTPCGNVALPSLVLYAGYSSPDYPITGPSSACRNQNVYYSCPTLPGATNYIWTWPSGWTYLGGQGTPNLSLRTPNTTGSGSISVRVATACDAGGSPAFKYTSVNSCFAAARTGNSEDLVSMYPNPSADQLVIEQKVSVLERNSKTVNGVNSTERQDIRIYDSKGAIRKTVKGLPLNTRQILNIADLPNGIYVVEMQTTAGLRYSKKIIVSR